MAQIQVWLNLAGRWRRRRRRRRRWGNWRGGTGRNCVCSRSKACGFLRITQLLSCLEKSFFKKNVCVIFKRSDFWIIGISVSGVLPTRLPRLCRNTRNWNFTVSCFKLASSSSIECSFRIFETFLNTVLVSVFSLSLWKGLCMDGRSDRLLGEPAVNTMASEEIYLQRMSFWYVWQSAVHNRTPALLHRPHPSWIAHLWI